MRAIDNEWIKSWAASTIMESFQEPLRLVYRDRIRRGSVVLVTESLNATNLILLANRIMWDESEGDDMHLLSSEDRSYVFWIREWGIWDDVSENIAEEVFATLRTGYCLPKDTRGVLFEVGDSRAAAVFVLMTMLFNWDAYLVPQSCLFLCHISHDGYVGFSARDEEILQQLLDRFKAWGALVKQLDY